MQNVYAYHLKAKQSQGNPRFSSGLKQRTMRGQSVTSKTTSRTPSWINPLTSSRCAPITPLLTICRQKRRSVIRCLRYKLDDNLSWQVIPAAEREPHKPAGDAGASETSSSQKPQIDQKTNDGGDPAHGQVPRAYFAK